MALFSLLLTSLIIFPYSTYIVFTFLCRMPRRSGELGGRREPRQDISAEQIVERRQTGERYFSRVQHTMEAERRRRELVAALEIQLKQYEEELRHLNQKIIREIRGRDALAALRPRYDQLRRTIHELKAQIDFHSGRAREVRDAVDQVFKSICEPLPEAVLPPAAQSDEAAASWEPVSPQPGLESQWREGSGAYDWDEYDI